MSNYVVISLRKIARDLEHHFDKDSLDEYTGQCTNCWADVSQTENECPNCGIQVVWKESKVWEQRYGSPNARIAQLEMTAPETESGEALCKACRVRGFSNDNEQSDWAKAERTFGSAEMGRIIAYVTKDKRGRAAMGHALAIARKRLREYRPVKDQETLDSPSAKML